MKKKLKISIAILLVIIIIIVILCISFSKKSKEGFRSVKTERELLKVYNVERRRKTSRNSKNNAYARCTFCNSRII